MGHGGVGGHKKKLFSPQRGRVRGFDQFSAPSPDLDPFLGHIFRFLDHPLNCTMLPAPGTLIATLSTLPCCQPLGHPLSLKRHAQNWMNAHLTNIDLGHFPRSSPLNVLAIGVTLNTALAAEARELATEDDTLTPRSEVVEGFNALHCWGEGGGLHGPLSSGQNGIP